MKRIFFIIIVLLITAGCSKSYTCPEEYELDDKKCIRFHKKEPRITETCEKDYELVDNECIKETTYTAKVNYNCPKNYILNNRTCNYNNTVTVKQTYSCPSGFELGEILGNYFCSRFWNPGPGQPCPDGVIRNQCNESAEVIVRCEKCPSGYTARTHCRCERNTSQPAKETFSCNNKDRLNGKNCITRDVKQLTKKSVCDEDYELLKKDNICRKKEVIDAIKN